MTKAEPVGDFGNPGQTNSLQVSNFPIDLLKTIVSGKNFPFKFEEPSEEMEEEIELSLGLSLNGRFGVDPRAQKLKRSSSIPDFMIPVKKEEKGYTLPSVSSSSNLVRTCSLPTETEQEWRKRKELQNLRRMEAKRKRSERQRNMKEKKEDGINGLNSQKEQCAKVLNEFSAMRMPSWVSSGSRGASFGFKVNGQKGNCLEGLPPCPPLSQGSIGSHGSGPSAISESETQKHIQATKSKPAEARSPSSLHNLPESDQKGRANLGTTDTEQSGNSAKVAKEFQLSKPSVIPCGAKEVTKNVLEDMPCVSAKGDGPNGKRIEGFLYRYKKGEEVRIVCVCHGSFLTPAEFVKHAGGGEVAHPLKHIVVNSNSFS